MVVLTDKELIEKYRKERRLGDLVVLYSRYESVVFRVCMKILKNAHDSEDATVDVFLELKDKIYNYKIKNFPAWLYRVVQNHCFKKLRKKGVKIIREVNSSDEKVESTSNEDHIEKMLQLLPNAIDELSEEQRWCIVLFYLHGKTYKEIEHLKGYSFNLIKSSIQHGKKNLKKKIEAYVR